MDGSEKVFNMDELLDYCGSSSLFSQRNTVIIKDPCFLINKYDEQLMKELGIFYGGLSGKTKNDFENGNAKFISYMNVYSNDAINIDVTDKVLIGDNEKQNKIQYGDIIFTGSSETKDDCAMTSVLTDKCAEDLYLNSFCFGFRFSDTSLFVPQFSKHYSF